MYVLCPFAKNWTIGSIRECGMGSSGFSCSRRQSVTAARRSSTREEGPTRDQGRRRVAPKTTSWSPPQLLPDQRSKDPRACSLGSSEIKLIKTTDNAALETTSCFLLF